MRTRVIAVLTALAFTALLAGSIRAQAPPSQPEAPPAVPQKGPIAPENQNQGTTSWQSPELQQGRGTPIAKSEAVTRAGPIWVDQPIRGYAGAASVNRGQPIKLYVSTVAPTWRLDLYRMGYYGGAGARLMMSQAGIAGRNQPVPAPDPATGLIEASWQSSYTLATGATWVSGIYLVKLTASTGQVGYITFVLRDDSTTSDIVFQVPVTTYQAYNNWGGKSLYDFNSIGGTQAVKVSFDRPYTAWSGAGSLFDGDFSMIRYLERQGYDVSYTTSVDLHQSNVPVTGHKVFLSNFHDEYWSAPMRDRLTAARNAGLNLAFFDANNIYWQVRFEASRTGAANRVMVSYKETAATADPIRTTQPALVTGMWREAPVNRPENELLGTMFESYFDYSRSYPWVVQNANHWVYTGTGVSNGTQIPGLVGYEYDKVWNNGKTPAGLVSLSNSPVVDGEGVAGTQNGGIYTAAGGAQVFNAGTIFWCWKLDDNDYQQHGADARVQRMTNNLLTTMITGVRPNPSASPSPTPGPLSLVIYDDALAPGWGNYSYSATVDFSSSAQVYAGTRSIAFSTTAAYGALSLQTTTPVSGGNYAYLRFAARASASGQRYSVRLYGPGVVPIGNVVLLANYGGDPVTTGWRVYSIPLDADNLNAAAAQISGVDLQDLAGRAEPVLYLDQLGFATAPAPTPSPTPTASPSPSPTATPTSTPAPTATPTATPRPTASPTPSPSPVPTRPPKSTPAPVPTPVGTPGPSATPRPTPTPAPSPLPGPTPKPPPGSAPASSATPAPIPTPAPKATPSTAERPAIERERANTAGRPGIARGGHTPM